MNSFFTDTPLKKKAVEIVQINMGNLCNLSCSHCHVEGSPEGKNIMSEETSLRIIETLKSLKVHQVEFTGGEPTLNKNLITFIEELHEISQLSVRSNLVALGMPANIDLLDVFKKYNIRIIGSLPSPFEESTDSQRGNGIFKKSLKVLRIIKEMDLEVDLVYNPTGSYLVDDTLELEKKYRSILKKNYNIEFNDFVSMVNVPVKRYHEFLVHEGTLEEYYDLLKSNYNPATVDRIMCRTLLSVDFQGNVYDCDFNLACGKQIKGYESRKFWDIDFTSFKPEITFADYCYACTVNQGSSCQGVLLDTSAGSGVKENIQEYYGETLQSSDDLKTNACCTGEDLPRYVKESLKYINDESVMRYYGCGSPIPPALEGLSALDVGCGTGRDVFILSRLTGFKGHASGIDMTKNQIQVAQKHETEQMNIFGYKEPNTTFIHDEMEHINRHFEKESLDLVISNCVINLAEDKELILRHIFNALKPGGEFYFSDVYADRRVPEKISQNKILYSECLGGALYYKDFERIARKVGFGDPRIMSSSSISIKNGDIEDLVGNIRFNSITYRLWKIEGLEDACEDYGHVAVYRGGIPYAPSAFELDGNHIFEKNKPERVCGNTALMISKSRFAKYFELIGDFSEHFGLFEDCSTESSESGNSTGGCC